MNSRDERFLSARTLTLVSSGWSSWLGDVLLTHGLQHALRHRSSYPLDDVLLSLLSIKRSLCISNLIHTMQIHLLFASLSADCSERFQRALFSDFRAQDAELHVQRSETSGTVPFL